MHTDCLELTLPALGSVPRLPQAVFPQLLCQDTCPPAPTGKGRATSLSSGVNRGPLKSRHHEVGRHARELLEGTQVKNKMEEADGGRESLCMSVGL